MKGQKLSLWKAFNLVMKAWQTRALKTLSHVVCARVSAECFGLIVCYYVTYAFQSEFTLYSYLSAKKLLARSSCKFWSLSENVKFKCIVQISTQNTVNHFGITFENTEILTGKDNFWIILSRFSEFCWTCFWSHQ